MMLSGIGVSGQTCFASLRDGPDEVVAVGLGVVGRRHLGLFDIAVAEPDARSRARDAVS
jgi:hypothetical protein